MREIARLTDEAARVIGFFFAFSFFAICSVPLAAKTLQTSGALLRRRDAPDDAASVVGDEQRAVGKKEQSDRTSVNVFAIFVGHPSDREVVVAAARFAVSKRNANDFVARSLRAIP